MLAQITTCPPPRTTDRTPPLPWVAALIAVLIAMVLLVVPVLVNTAAAATDGQPKVMRKPAPPAASTEKLSSGRKAPLSKADGGHLKSALDGLTTKSWRQVSRHIGQIKNPLARNLALWHLYTTPDSPGRFEAVSAFVATVTDWPRQKTLARRIEETLPAAWAPDKVLAYFGKHGKPVSLMGRVRVAEAWLDLEKKNKKPADAETVGEIRKLWVSGNFTRSQEKRFYKKHKKLLTADDHLKRLDRLIWAGRNWPARRQLWKVGKEDRKLAVARIWLMNREGNVDKAIAEVPEHLKNDAGLLYERLRWRRRKDKFESAAELLLNPPVNLSGIMVRPEKWWRERAYLARAILRKGDAKSAYRLAAEHGLPGEFISETAEAEWMAGWIALSFLEQPGRAIKHFGNMLAIVRFPVSVARAEYWIGRALEAAGKTNDARSRYTLAALHSTTYYGQLAEAKLHLRRTAPIQPLKRKAPSETREHQLLERQPLTSAINMLAQIDEHRRMRPFIMALNARADTPTWQAAVAALARKSGRPDLAIRIAKAAHQNGTPLGRDAYPTLQPPKVTGDNAVETALVLAVIRQESAFYPGAKSHAGARGLMQILPATAKRVAKANRLPYSRDRLTGDPNYNLQLGQLYLSGLIDDFDGSYVLALAGYNAGPSRAQRWMREFGDPRKAKTDIVDWVENIPFVETRDYVQRVMGNLNVYRRQNGDGRYAIEVAQKPN